MGQMIARYKPGQEVSALAATTIAGGTFVKVSATKTARGDYQVVPCVAGDAAFGVAQNDADATLDATAQDRLVNVVRRGAVARVIAGGSISAGALVQSDANAKAIAYTAPNTTAVGAAIATTPVVLGIAMNTVTNGQTVEVDLF